MKISNIYTLLLTLFLTTGVANAQNGIEKEKTSKKEQVKQDKDKNVEQQINDLKEEMKTASEKDKAKIQEKINELNKLQEKDIKEMKEYQKEQEDYVKKHGVHGQDGVKEDKALKMDHPKIDGHENEKVVKSNDEKIAKDKENPNNGNAYGKNKEGLTGREFGQARAAEARSKINNFEERVDERKMFIEDARHRINAAKERVDELEKNGEKPEIIAEKRQKIIETEEKLNRLEERIIDAQMRLGNQKEKLMAVYSKKE